MSLSIARVLFPALLAGSVLTACVDASEDAELGTTAQEAVMTGVPWSGGVINYYIDTDGSQGPSKCQQTSTEVASGDPISPNEAANITRAIARYNSFTPLKMQPGSLSSMNTLIFTKRSRGQVAHAGTSGQPDRTTGTFSGSTLHPCLFLSGNNTNGSVNDTDDDTVEHELGHTLGMPHEQRRTDAGNYINLNLDCVAWSDFDGDGVNDNLAAYKLDVTPSMRGPYDYKSTMQYSSTGKLCKQGGLAGTAATPCPSDCGVGMSPRWTLQRQCDSNNPYWPFAGGCDKYVDATHDLSVEDINVIYRRYEQALGANDGNDHLGAAMATGDFDGDGYLDLAVGAPAERRTIGGADISTGLVFLWRGTSERMVAWKWIASPTPVDGGQFGYALAAGDLDGDGADELIVGAPGERDSAGTVDGRVHIYRTVDTTELGSSVARKFGLGDAPWKSIDHTSAGLAAGGNDFGTALAVGNFDLTGPLDLAIGAPDAVHGGVAAGVVVIASHLNGTVTYRTVTQASLSTERAGERFGEALSAGKLGTNWLLLVGAPETHTGGFLLSPGHAYTFGATSSAMLPLEELSHSTPVGMGDRFGAAVAISTFSTGLVFSVGSPDEDNARGRIYVFRAPTAGQVLPLALVETLAAPSGTAADGDRLGDVLAAVRSGNTYDTLVAGMPTHDAGGQSNSGGYVRWTPGTSLPFTSGTLIDNPSPSAGEHFGASSAFVGTYDHTLGTKLDQRLVIGSDGAAGEIHVRTESGSSWLRLDQTTATPE